MATKDNFFKDKYKSFNYCHSDTGAQYFDLGLNRNLKCSNIFPIQSNSKSYNNKKIDPTLLESYEEKEKSQTWKISSTTDLCSRYSNNLNDENEKCWDKNDFSNATNNSTLSLHISVYENEASSDSFNKSFQKSWLIKKQKQINHTATFISQNPFEFPRQQNDSSVSEPEVSQFKTSQRLLNSNKSHLYFNTANQRQTYSKFFLISVFATVITPVYGCRHDLVSSNMDLTFFEIFFLTLITLLFTFLCCLVSKISQGFCEIRELNAERRRRFQAYRKIQSFNRTQVHVPLHFLQNYYEHKRRGVKANSGENCSKQQIQNLI